MNEKTLGGGGPLSPQSYYSKNRLGSVNQLEPLPLRMDRSNLVKYVCIERGECERLIQRLSLLSFTRGLKIVVDE